VEPDPFCHGRLGAQSGVAGVRLAFNRDELRGRPPGLPPSRRRFGPRQAIMPIDPVSGGTWIAMNDAGLAMAVMNVYPVPRIDEADEPAAARRNSRGAIIPSLLHCATIHAAAKTACRLEVSRYPLFRLLLVDRTACLEVLSDGRQARVRDHGCIDRPLFFTSSGLGDQVVDPPRRALFEASFVAGRDLVGEQDAFHRHVWPDQTRLSVCMSRDEARTVSHTVIELRPSIGWFTYYSDFPEDANPEISVDQLEWRPAVANG